MLTSDIFFLDISLQLFATQEYEFAPRWVTDAKITLLGKILLSLSLQLGSEFARGTVGVKRYRQQ